MNILKNNQSLAKQELQREPAKMGENSVADKAMWQIYKITCLENGKIYIGQTKCGVEERWIKHKHSAKAGSVTHFHNAIRKYGIDAFKIEVISACDTLERANFLEKYFVTEFDSFNNGYNKTEGGDGVPGHIASEATRLKISTSNKGRINWNKGKSCSDTHKQRISQANKGRKHSEEFKAKCVKNLTGRPCLEKTREKMRLSHSNRSEEDKIKIGLKIGAAHKGKKPSDTELEHLKLVGYKKGHLPWNTGIKYSPEVLKQMSEAHKGQIGWNKGLKASPETLKKLSDSHKGIKYSEESKRKRSVSLKAYYKKRKLEKINKEITDARNEILNTQV